LRIQPHFDLKQHIRELHRFVLPFFFLLGAVMMVLFIAFRAGEEGPGVHEAREPSLNGLIRPGKEATFDPLLAVLSPIEMVLAPDAVSFDAPSGSEHGALTYNAQPFLLNRHLGDDLNGIGGQNSDLGDPVYAVSEGRVLQAGWAGEGWGNVVVLLHERNKGEMVKTLYGHLDSIRVAVGGQVRRGDPIGTIGDAAGRYPAHLHFELSPAAALEIGPGYADSGMGRLSGEHSLREWRVRSEDRISAAPVGEALESSAFNLDVEDPAGKER